MKWNKLERKLSWQMLWKYEPLQLSFLLRFMYNLLPFSTNLTQWTLSDGPLACCTNIMSYNVILVALSQYRYRWLHTRVLEREKDQRTRLSRSSSDLLDFEISRYTLPGHMPPSTVLQRLHPGPSSISLPSCAPLPLCLFWGRASRNYSVFLFSTCPVDSK